MREDAVCVCVCGACASKTEKLWILIIKRHCRVACPCDGERREEEGIVKETRGVRGGVGALCKHKGRCREGLNVPCTRKIRSIEEHKDTWQPDAVEKEEFDGQNATSAAALEDEDGWVGVAVGVSKPRVASERRRGVDVEADELVRTIFPR